MRYRVRSTTIRWLHKEEGAKAPTNSGTGNHPNQSGPVTDHLETPALSNLAALGLSQGPTGAKALNSANESRNAFLMLCRIIVEP